MESPRRAWARKSARRRTPLQVGTTPQGFPVFADRLAWESDGIVVVNRVKPHSDLSGGIESGMLKMMAIGLGKREGATEGHKQIWKYGFEPTIRAVSAKILASGKILFGVAIVENEMHAVADVRAALAGGHCGGGRIRHCAGASVDAAAALLAVLIS